LLGYCSLGSAARGRLPSAAGNECWHQAERESDIPCGYQSIRLEKFASKGGWHRSQKVGGTDLKRWVAPISKGGWHRL
jgi:hypothetical protein